MYLYSLKFYVGEFCQDMLPYPDYVQNSPKTYGGRRQTVLSARFSEIKKIRKIRKNKEILRPRSKWPGSSVGIATRYRLDGPGIESLWRQDFPHPSRPAMGPTQPPVQCVPALSGGKERSGRDADPSPLLVPWSRKSRAIPPLPLWAVRLVQSLSACTVQLYL